MDWLKSLAPALGTALLGPIGGAAASFIADKLGLPEKTVEAVTQALTGGAMTTEQISALKLAEIDFKKFLTDNEIKLESFSVADRANARDMQKTAPSKMPAILTAMITLGFFGVLGWMLTDTSVVDSSPVMIMLGSLGTAWTGACSYWFGTTSGSRAKTELLAAAPAK